MEQRFVGKDLANQSECCNKRPSFWWIKHFPEDLVAYTSPGPPYSDGQSPTKVTMGIILLSDGGATQLHWRLFLVLRLYLSHKPPQLQDFKLFPVSRDA